jgi:hypothetical protein
MKRKARKLMLNRETLRHLQGDELRRAAAGTGCSQEFQTTCVCTEACNSNPGTYGCPTQGQSCGCPPGCQSDTNEFLSGCASNCG